MLDFRSALLSIMCMNNIEEQQNLIPVPEKDLKRALRCLKLFLACPPTARQVIETGDRAIELAGLDSYCMNERLATGDEKISTWPVEEAIEAIEAAISNK